MSADCPVCRDLLAQRMAYLLLRAGVTDRASAEALTIDQRDEILHVAAWGGTEDDAWRRALRLLEAA